MSEMTECRCSKCGAIHRIPHVSRIDASDSVLKEKLLDGSLFVWECPACLTHNLASWPLLYMDNSQKFLVLLSSERVSSEGSIPGFTARLVGSVGELIEKVKVLDAGLDDLAVELCKYITLQEMGKDADLKFFRLEGPDSGMVFTYPEDGQMQMIQLGFNVYEDCRGIISRNSILTQKAKGLVRVDREWISAFCR